MSGTPLDPSLARAIAVPRPATAGAWDATMRWIRIYSIWQILLVAIILWGAHFFALLGRPWTTCLEGHTGAMDWRCIAFFHIYEVPLVVLIAYHGWFGLRRMRPAVLPYYFFLTLFQEVMLVAYVTFEAKVLFDSLARHAPPHEDFLLLAGGSGMVFGCVLGYFIVFHKLLPFFLSWCRGGSPEEPYQAGD
jgi:hypothetical protein